LSVREISPGVYLHQGVHEEATPANLGGIANIGFVGGEQAVAVIDSGGSARQGAALLAAVRTVTDLPVRYVINTHMHPDHVFGNAAFRDEGSLFVGHAKLPRALAARGGHYLERLPEFLGEASAGTEVVPPSLTVTNQLEIDLGDRPILLIAHPTAHSPERYIRALTLIIDKNPAPVAAVFQLTPRSGTATISTRVRIDAYTHVRVVAEINDGTLYMATKFVKASGGCSAPAIKDADAALARLGKIKLRQSAPARLGQPNEVQLLISHPNHSGFQRDPLTLYYIPAHFVRDVTVSYGRETILTVEGAISLSEDPSFHFSFVLEVSGELRVEAWDTDEQEFTGSWPIEPEAGS
jgi:sulfur-oxidizing protein SoxY